MNRRKAAKLAVGGGILLVASAITLKLGGSDYSARSQGISEEDSEVLNFDRSQSHRWADHVKAWSLALKNKSVEEVCYNRSSLSKDSMGTNYTPLMTSLMYAIGMDQKMNIEENAQRVILNVQKYDLDYLIEEDTNHLMALFVQDAKTLLSGTAFEKDVSGLSSQNYGSLSFKENWKRVLEVKPSRDNIESVISDFIRARLAQEYATIKGAVTSYHMMMSGPGEEIVKEATTVNAEAIAYRITAKLYEVMGVANLEDTDGMRTDHYIEDTRGLVSDIQMIFKPVTVHKYFLNCPIAEVYAKTDEVLSEIYNFSAGFASGSMSFCEVCKKHGSQSVNVFLPRVLTILDHNRADFNLSAGGENCDFYTKISFGNASEADERINSVMEKIKNPPALKVF